MNVLAVRLDAAGDVLMCTPALAALVSTGHRVTLLTSDAGAMPGGRLDSVHEVLVFRAPWMKADADMRPEGLLGMAQDLKSRCFDIAVIFTSYSQSPLPAAMLCHLAGIPRRAAHCRENPYGLLTDWIRECEPEQMVRHEVQRQLDLVAQIGCAGSDPPDGQRLRLRITEDDRRACASVLTDAGIAGGDRFVLLHPGATAASRRYPEDRWLSLISLLSRRVHLPLLIAGGPDDLALAHRLHRSSEGCCVSVAGRLDFGGLAALIDAADVLVANNSAPAHLAAVCNTPVVVLYALTNPQHTPWLVENRVLFHPVPCHTCYQSVCPQRHQRCLTGIAPEVIVDAVISLLHSTD